MTILALDIATQCGWCLGKPGATPSYGSVRLLGKGASDGSVLAAMADWLNGQIVTHTPIYKVAYEAPLPGGQQSSINQAKLALRLSGIVELLCWRRQIACRDVHVKSVRAAIVGNGNCKKPDVAAWLVAMGWPMPLRNGEVDFDACDAAAVWAYTTRGLA